MTTTKPKTKTKKKTTTKTIWERLLAAKTFNSSEGRTLQSDARSKIKALPADLDAKTAETIYRFYLREAEFELWRAAAKPRDVHVAAFLRAIEKDKTLPSLLLRAANEEDGANGFRSMGELLAFAGSSSNIPALLKRAHKSKAKFDSKSTVTAVHAVLPKIDHDTAEREILIHGAALWFGLVKDNKGGRFAKAIRKQMKKWDDDGLGYDPGCNTEFFESVSARV